MIASSIRDEPCVTPIMDTWRNWDGAGSWTWSPRGPWGVEQLAAVIDALRPIARVHKAIFGGPLDASPIAMPEHTWREAVRHDDFERSLIETAVNEVAPITTIDLVLDLRVWVRTATSRVTPVLGWVCRAADVAIYFGPGAPHGTLEIHHTLFIDGNLAGDPNAELHRRNQPLLRDALAAIESRLGPIAEVAGLPGISSSGFTSNGLPPSAT